ncbi:MAG: PEP-CTERM sorting domain-containing protein [Cyanobacteria bacterium P01_H01_bin.119]
MSKTAIAGTVATLGITAVGLAPAQAITFDFTGSFDIEPSFSFNEEGVGLTVTPFSTNPLPTGVVRTGFGMGVTSFLDTSFQVDGFGFQDALKLTFDRVVEMTSVTFGFVDRKDEFTLFVDGVEELSDEDIPGGSNTYFFSPTFLGEQFAFAAIEKNDDFYVKRVDVEAVPEPAAMVGLGVVAAGLLAQRRSRKVTV